MLFFGLEGLEKGERLEYSVGDICFNSPLSLFV